MQTCRSKDAVNCNSFVHCSVELPIYHTTGLVSDMLPSHSWLCIPGLLFLVIQAKLVFSCRMKSVNNFVSL